MANGLRMLLCLSMYVILEKYDPGYPCLAAVDLPGVGAMGIDFQIGLSGADSGRVSMRGLGGRVGEGTTSDGGCR
jgi:hypothetical protein